MIARDVEIVDLDPALWRNLSAFWRVETMAEDRPENPNGLAILHEGGSVLRMHVPEGYRVTPISQVDDPQALAKRLFYQYPGMDGVQILEKSSILNFSSQIQKADWQSMDYDDFFFHAFRLMEQDPAGLCFFPPRSLSWKGFDVPAIRSWMEALPGPCAIVLGITRASTPWFTLIIKIVEKKIRLITTMEYLARENPDVRSLPTNPADVQAMADLVSQKIAPVAAAVVCDHSVFEKVLAAEKKAEALWQGMAEGKAAAIGLPMAASPGIIA